MGIDNALNELFEMELRQPSIPGTCVCRRKWIECGCNGPAPGLGIGVLDHLCTWCGLPRGAEGLARERERRGEAAPEGGQLASLLAHLAKEESVSLALGRSVILTLPLSAVRFVDHQGLYMVPNPKIRAAQIVVDLNGGGKNLLLSVDAAK